MGKKAAAPAGEKEKKVVEDKKIEEKAKPQQQQQQTQQKGKGKGAKEEVAVVVEEQKQQKEETGKKDIKERELDQEEKVIFARIEKLDDEIRARRAEIDKIQENIDTKKQSNKKLQEEQKGLWEESAKQGDSKEFSNQYLKKLEQIKEQQKYKKTKMDEQKKLKDQMGHSVKEKDLKNLEAEIRRLQDKQQSGNVGNIHEERKIIAEISKLTTNKKLFKTYAELNESIAQYETTISALRADLGKIDEEHNVLKDKKKVFDDQAYAKRADHDSTSKLIDDAYTEKKRLVAEVKGMEERKDNIYDQLRAYRSTRREQAQKKREDEQKKRKEDKEAAEQKRQQEEETKGFYSEEIDACTQLLSYLEPFKFCPPVEEEKEEKEGEKEEKEGGEGEGEKESEETPAPAAEEKPKRGGKKKAVGETDKEKELKHAAQTFFQFELLSLVAPAKVGDVESTIGQINEKKVYLEKKQEERKERKAN